MAQGNGVNVDLGVLDQMAPANPTPQKRIELKKPQEPKPKTRPATSASKSAPPASTDDNAASPAPPNQATTDEAPAGQAASSKSKIVLRPPSQATTKAPDAPALVPPPAPVQAVKAPPPPKLPTPTVGANAKPTPPPAQAYNASLAVPGSLERRILFTADGVTLPDDAKADLSELAKRLSADGHLYVQIVAYSGDASDASAARRVSLTRALAARSYLVDQGAEIKQVDVRPLGNRSEPGLPPDRVDIVVAQR